MRELHVQQRCSFSFSSFFFLVFLPFLPPYNTTLVALGNCIQGCPPVITKKSSEIMVFEPAERSSEWKKQKSFSSNLLNIKNRVSFSLSRLCTKQVQCKNTLTWTSNKHTLHRIYIARYGMYSGFKVDYTCVIWKLNREILSIGFKEITEITPSTIFRMTYNMHI